jgi:tetratricopeptide (TPR) repeat protein
VCEYQQLVGDLCRSAIVRLAVLAWAALLSNLAPAADLDDAEQLFQSGHYEEAEKFAREQVERGIWNERWPRLLIQCQLTRGKYAEAMPVYEAAIKRYPTSLSLRMQGWEVLRYNNRADEASEAKNQILRLLQSSSSRYASRDNLVAAGRYFAAMGEDARQILQLFYDRVREADPQYLDAYVATAELALEKGDFKVAADTLAQAQRLIESRDPQVDYLLARSWESSDAEKATAALERALQLNPKHVPSLLLRAHNAIDGEQYDAAETILGQIVAINPHQQEAWALRAVIAHLRGDDEQEAVLRQTALSHWKDNPRVDHWIGLKLSQKYRFEEGAAYQRKAIEMDALFTPARFQLAQDLLRLGHDDVGWELARLVADEDQYNVVAHNLITLSERLKQFTILESDGIQVRMDSHEAAVYGDAVMQLLREAQEVLCRKYEVQPRAPIVVEIFPEQKDFAIRTFGLPGGAGFLGVCFGRVITANSPASQGERPSNWRSVLWHEFCHVVTLEKTRNRMPRWLSEGISVYEERQRDGSWGETITPVYRQMLLADDLTPVSQLSAAFLSPPSPVHLQFAYYQSSLVIEFLVAQHGLDAIKQILDDLGNGLNINDALVRSVGSLEKLDAQFAQFAREQAESFGAAAEWSRESMPQQPSPGQLANWVEQHPNSYWGLRGLGEMLVAAGQYEQAKAPLEKLRDLGAATGEQGGPLELLARVLRELGDTEAEEEVLRETIQRSSDALPALRRLIEMARQDGKWSEIAGYAEKFRSIQPLLPDGHAALAEAAEQLQQHDQVIAALRALARMDPVDPAELDFRLARSLAKRNDFPQARHHVLQALAEAPRYRDAHRLLLELSEASSSDPPPSPAEPDKPVAAAKPDTLQPERETAE